MRHAPFSASFAVGLCTLVACSSATTTVVDPDAGSSGSSGSSSGTSGTSGGTSGASGTSGTSGGTSGTSPVACTDEGLPTPPASCIVEGTYDVTAEVKCPACAGAVAFANATWTVTVNGNEVKLLGKDTLKKCTLENCTCTQTGGNTIIFNATGFIGLGSSSNASCAYKVLEKGARR